ncbi:MAG: ASPIC/UnbV domain-containing protein [Mycetocola sp.]
MTTAVGYASASSPLVHFGLGDVSIVDAVDVRWPAGTSQRVTGVTADRILELREPTRPEKGRR